MKNSRKFHTLEYQICNFQKARLISYPEMFFYTFEVFFVPSKFFFIPLFNFFLSSEQLFHTCTICFVPLVVVLKKKSFGMKQLLRVRNKLYKYDETIVLRIEKN
jgi:hypothetical protein